MLFLYISVATFVSLQLLDFDGKMRVIFVLALRPPAYLQTHTPIPGLCLVFLRVTVVNGHKEDHHRQADLLQLQGDLDEVVRETIPLTFSSHQTALSIIILDNNKI